MPQRIKNLKKSINLVEQIEQDNKKNQTKPIPNFFGKFYISKKNYEKAKKEAEEEYNEALNKTFKVASASDDYKTAFEFFKLIQNEGNNFTKSKILYKIGIRLLGGIGCKKDISQGRELIKKASELGLTSTSIWINKHGSKNDFGASEVIRSKMI
ncbi:7900_t:CDS:2 [Gigaspora margarita]|uniref:7900_t:CDS:1 n=1 Tax=Gigaspora margarita TaxID=4874 RepID=A0ABN7W7L5_GIGMA|nr:7900_t:CDS:2 [Gigaspora margarita]